MRQLVKQLKHDLSAWLCHTYLCVALHVGYNISTAHVLLLDETIFLGNMSCVAGNIVAVKL